MRRRFVAFVLLSWTVAACGALLGIEQLPLLEESDAAVGDAADAADAAPQCIDDPRLGCQNCPHAFCDDFDLDAGEAGVGSRWISPVTPSGGPIFQARDGSAARGRLVPDNVSPPFGFEAFVSSNGGSSVAFLVNQIGKHEPGANFAGVRYRFKTRVQALDVSLSGAQLTDSGGVIFAGIGPSDLASSAIGLFLNADGLWVALATNLLTETNADGSVHSITSLSGFGDQPIPIDVFVTTRERALAEHLKCEAVSTPTVVAVRVSPIFQGCFAPIGPLADIAWTRDPTILLGASTFGQGTVGLVHDNVEVDFLE